MAKRRIGFLLVLATCASVASVLFIGTRPAEEVVFFGPHKARLEFVPASEANVKPWFDFNLPGIGRLQYPRGTPVPGIERLPDAENAAGYIVAEGLAVFFATPDPVLGRVRRPSMYAKMFVPAGTTLPKVSIAVPFAKSATAAERPLTLVVVPGFEEVKVTRRFVGTR